MVLINCKIIADSSVVQSQEYKGSFPPPTDSWKNLSSSRPQNEYTGFISGHGQPPSNVPPTSAPTSFTPQPPFVPLRPQSLLSLQTPLQPAALALQRPPLQRGNGQIGGYGIPPPNEVQQNQPQSYRRPSHDSNLNYNQTENRRFPPYTEDNVQSSNDHLQCMGAEKERYRRQNQEKFKPPETEDRPKRKRYSEFPH